MPVRYERNQYVSMNRISSSVRGLVASLALLACAAPVGVASAAELRESPPNSHSLETTNPPARIAGVYFHVENGFSLGRPNASPVDVSAARIDQLLDVGDKGAGYKFAMWWKPDGRYVHRAAVQWPILEGQDGAGTGLVVKTELAFNHSGGYNFYSKCSVVDSNGQKAAHVGCSIEQRGADFDWDLHLRDDRVNRLAEASGSVRTDGSVSLDASYFRPTRAYTTQSKLRVDGADDVSPNSSTQFGAVLTPDDLKPPKKPDEPETARMTFTYAIRDASAPGGPRVGPQYFVYGNVSNYIGKKFTGASSCEIRDESSNPVQNSGYTCEMNSYYGGAINTPGRAQYITDFTVSKKK